ncbi:HAD family hydrolase [Deinococcus roseus]|nr:HAD family hydrolase [Deinococcus roseus]
MLKTLFFDIDDTLFDHYNSMQAAFERIYHQTPEFQTRPLPEMHALHKKVLEEVHDLYVIPRLMTLHEARKKRFEILLEQCGTTNGTLAERLKDDYRTTFLESRILLEGTEKLLADLKGKVKIGVISNNSIEEQTEKLQTLGIYDFIDVWVMSGEFGFGKPDPRIYQIALERAGCAAHEAMMIGDDHAKDVEAAQKAGIRAIWLNRFGHPAPSPDVTQITSLADLYALEELQGLLSATEPKR